MGRGMRSGKGSAQSSTALMSVGRYVQPRLSSVVAETAKQSSEKPGKFDSRMRNQSIAAWVHLVKGGSDGQINCINAAKDDRRLWRLSLHIIGFQDGYSATFKTISTIDRCNKRLFRSLRDVNPLIIDNAYVKHRRQSFVETYAPVQVNSISLMVYSKRV